LEGSTADSITMATESRRLRLRRADQCATCEIELPVGTIALWDAARREVRCIYCGPQPGSVLPPPELLKSAAGASARREYERRRASREARVRDRLGPIAPLALAVVGEPAHQRAWARGAVGEVKLAAKLEHWTAEAGVVLLHDRRVPSSVANIDHIAVGPAGVFVIDAKRYKGRIAVERRGGLLRDRSEHLIVRGSDRSKLVDGVLRQLEVVRAGLDRHTDVPLRGVLCFVDGDWPLFGSLEVRGIPVLSPRKAARLCSGEGPLTAERVRTIALRLASAFPRA
jgi:hypothetical protein